MQSRIQNPKSKIALIAAMSRDHVIARRGEMPWHMPADLKRFKKVTSGHAVIMGRRTWTAMAGPLPDRTNIVITRNPSFAAQGAIVAGSLEAAIDAARQQHPHDDQWFIIGGEEIFRQSLHLAERLDLTLIDTVIPDGDTFFPQFEHNPLWRLIREEHHPADQRHAHAYAFMEYRREGTIAPA